MSEDSSRTPDISKVISVIMENPDILERISSLVKGDSASATDTEEKKSVQTVSAPPTDSERRGRRAQLLSAIKPYVRKGRKEAIDSVMAIADIVDMMRRK